MAVSGGLINTGGVVTTEFVGAVNAQHIISGLDETVMTVSVDSLQFSNTPDFSVLVTPTAGHMDLEATTDDVTWFFMQAGQLLCKYGQAYPARSTGDIKKIRVTSATVSGALYFRIKIKQSFSIDASLDPRITIGSQALTVQPFTEANCKAGVQYEISAYNPALAAGASQDTIVITGNKPVVIKNRQIGFDGGYIISNTYKNPTYTGGVALPYYNLSEMDPQAGTAVFLGGATVTNTGTQVAATTHAIGSDTPGTGSVAHFGSYATEGLERIFPPNSTYLVRITNGNGVACKVSVYATWYEGLLNIHN
jgi:hypothetical protein